MTQALICLILLAGCATEPPPRPVPERIILLPSTDGRASSIVVTTNDRQITLATPYAVAEAGSVATATTADEVDLRYGRIIAMQPKRPRGNKSAVDVSQCAAQPSAGSFPEITSMRSVRLRRLAGVLMVTSTACGVYAQPVDNVVAYPVKAVRVIVPYSTGGGTDIMTRVVTQKLSEMWGQQLVVDNRAGGGTVIGTQLGARSPADGYTL